MIGLLLLVPAVAGWAVSYLGPTLWTVRNSFRHVSPIRGLRPERYVGLANYREIGADTLTAYGFALSLGIVPLLLAVVVAPLLAYAAHRAGRPSRWAVRVAFAVPMVLVSPALLAVSWLLYRAEPEDLATPGTAAGTVRLVAWLTTVGLVCGVAVTVYLAAFRVTGTDRQTPNSASRPRCWPAALTAGVLLAIGTQALALQTFAYPLALAGRRDATQSPLLLMVRTAFVEFDLGVGAAHGTILLAILAVLGVISWLLVMLTNLRVEVTPDGPGQPGHPSLVWAAAGGVLLLAVLGVVGYGLWPWLSHSVGGRPWVGEPSPARLFINTWLSPLPSTVVGVGGAALGGYGIGALRPLGRFSEWLLLPFAPWLFTGLGPVALANSVAADSGRGRDSFVEFIPPMWLVVPALFLFALLFRGLTSQHGSPAACPPVRLIRSGLPMLAVVGGATWLVQAQDFTWAFFVAKDAENATGPVFATMRAGTQPGTPENVSLNPGYPLVLVLVLAALLAAAQLRYLDRLSIRIGRERHSAPGPTPGRQVESTG